MTQPRVLMCSMWRNDLHRQLVDRVEHLLVKCEAWPNLRYVWVVGDSTDGTVQALRDLSVGYPVTVLDIETGIVGDDLENRLRRLSVTANHYLRHVDGADYVLIHESDIVSPYNLVARMVANAERGVCPVAAWPTLEIEPGRKVFYDTYVYRKDGVRFTNTPPYHACYRLDEVFTVDSAGTVMLFHAEDASEIVMAKGAFLDMCLRLRKLGRTIYVDPTIEVVQPFSLWRPR